jgi:hypothetical protein
MSSAKPSPAVLLRARQLHRRQRRTSSRQRNAIQSAEAIPNLVRPKVWLGGVRGEGSPRY